MDIDLCNQNISELVFDPASTSEDERLVATTVECLRAEHNQIHHISGLGSSFQNLTMLFLRDNALGTSSTAPHDAIRRVRHDRGVASLCEGIAPWVAALPSSLRTLDVSHNHLRSFLHCTCHVAPAGTLVEPVRNDDPSSERFLRHACPLSLCLFFPQERFPFLCDLIASNNAFSCSAQESQTMEDYWEGQLTTAATAHTPRRFSSISRLNVSNCPGLFALNPFALASAPHDDRCGALESVVASATSVNDLTAVSGLSFYAPRLTTLALSSTPICGDILNANPIVLSEFLEDMINSMVPGALRDDEDSANSQDTLATALMEAAHELAFDRLQELGRAMDTVQRTTDLSAKPETEALSFVHKEAPSGELATLRSCVYALLLRTVIPSLTVVDETMSTDMCRRALVEAALTTLASSGAASREDVAIVGTTERGGSQGAPSFSDLGALAQHADPQLRARVIVPDDSARVMDEDASGASEASAPQVVVSAGSVSRYQDALNALQPGLRRMQEHRTKEADADDAAGDHATGDDPSVLTGHPAVRSDSEASDVSPLFVPSRLTGMDKTMFEELSREAAALQEKLTASRSSHRALVEQTAGLREQLVADRALVRDQRQELLRLRTLRDELAAKAANQRALLVKRRKEVDYGVRAIESKEAAARHRDAIAELEKQQRQDRQKQRTMQRLTSQNSTFSVQYAHNAPPPPEPRKTRSDRLREEAIQQRMALHAASEGTFTYEPKPFRSHHTTPTVPAKAPQTSKSKSPEQLEEEYFDLYSENLQPPQTRYTRSTASGGSDDANTAAGSSELPHRDVAARSDVPADPRGVPVPRAARVEPVRPRKNPADTSTVPPVHTLSPASPYSALSDTSADPLPLVEKDLSTLSLTELFEAAAAVRRKQMALQQIHQHWAPDSTVGSETQPQGAKLTPAPSSLVHPEDEAPVNRALFESSLLPGAEL